MPKIIELTGIMCLGVESSSFDSLHPPPMLYLAVSLVEPGGEKPERLVTPPSPMECEKKKVLWYGRMPFSAAAAGQDLLEFELILRRDEAGGGGDIPIASATVPISKFYSFRSLLWVSGKLRTADGNPCGNLTVYCNRPRDADASSSSATPAALENCCLMTEFEKDESEFERDGDVASSVADSSESELVEAKIPHPPNPEVRGRQDQADLARIMETACKSLRSFSDAPVSSVEEDDGGLVFDTSVGTIDLTNLQVMENKDLVELKELGSGAFGTVYHGKWRGTDVAIKRINKNCLKGQQDRLILETLKEAGILANLLHPNVVSLYGFVLDELDSSNLAIVTELVADGSLRSILHRGDKFLDHYRRLFIAKGAASGMEYLHLKKIVHFDLKCDNLLVDLKDPSSPICKVADFGLSKVKQDTLVSSGIRGTLPWMAPELLKGDRSKVSEKLPSSISASISSSLCPTNPAVQPVLQSQEQVVFLIIH